MTKPLILVLEDDPVAGEALSLILRDWGAEILLCTGAGDLDLVLGDRADALTYVITDFHLGSGPDGVTLISRLKLVAPQVRVLVLSGSTHGRAAEAAAQAGFDAMQKPARPGDIIAWLVRE